MLNRSLSTRSGGNQSPFAVLAGKDLFLQLAVDLLVEIAGVDRFLRHAAAVAGLL